MLKKKQVIKKFFNTNMRLVICKLCGILVVFLSTYKQFSIISNQNYIAELSIKLIMVHFGIIRLVSYYNKHLDSKAMRVEAH